MDRNHLDSALASIDEAIRLNPAVSEYYGMKAQLLGQQHQWQAALQAAEDGLTFDPENEACGALRSLALERLGKVVDALRQAQESLRQNPDSTWAHSSLGWALLQKGDAKGAQKSFAEALRLSPNNEMARSGMIQALNSTNLLYRVCYLVLIKMSRLNSNVQWMLILGLWFGMRALRTLAKSNPSLAPWVLPITLLYLLLVMMSWIMLPLFNTMLRFHPFGKYLLTGKEKWASNLIAGTLVISLVLGCCVGFIQGDWIAAVLPFITGLYLTIPIIVPFNCGATWARWVAILVASIFALLYLAIAVPLVFGYFSEALYPIYMLGILVYCFAGQALARVESKH